MTNLVNAHLAHCRAAGLADRTIKTRRELFARLDRVLPLGLTRASYDDLVEFLGNQSFSPGTQRAYLAHIQQFFRWAADPNRPVGLDLDPSAGLGVPRVPKRLPRPLTHAERETILAKAQPPYLSWAKIALLTGMRCCEIAGIDLDRGDIDESRVLVRHGKGGRSREIPTRPEVWEIVKHLPGGPLARTPSGRPADANHISIKSALHFRRHLALPGVGLHRCRHSFATDLVEAGVDIRVIQELMGHESLNSTQVYTLVTDRQRRLAIQTLPTVAPISC